MNCNFASIRSLRGEVCLCLKILKIGPGLSPQTQKLLTVARYCFATDRPILSQQNTNDTELFKEPLDKKAKSLKQNPGNDILAGNRKPVIERINLHLIDELQLCLHPVIAGGGLPLFENIENRTGLKPTNTKTFKGGTVLLCYGPAKH